MRGARAKLLRRLAEEVTVGVPPVMYTHQSSTSGHAGRMIVPEPGKRLRLGGRLGTVVLAPGCTRYHYQKILKKAA